MNIAITGASGFVGRRLLAALSAHTLTMLTRSPTTQAPAGVKVSVWDPVAQPARLDAADAVIHLAGEPVAQRWTNAVKSRIRESRVRGTRNLVAGMRQMEQPPAVLVCASAIGYYGSRGDEVLGETSAPGTGFLSEVCVEWEHEADAAAALGVRVVKVRIGIVLEPHGGALARMLPPFRAGLGGPLGSGNQWMSWIHLDDLVELIVHAVENPLQGVLNGVAPNAATNAEFTRELGRALHRPAIIPVPDFAIKLLFGEMAEMLLLASQRVVPIAALQSGFRFAYPDLGEALRDLLATS
jgi:uncharacterized protein (TIGR01777 family)